MYGSEIEIKKVRQSNGVNKKGCDNGKVGKMRRYDRCVEGRVEVVLKNGRKRDLVIIHVPPKTNAWGREEYGNMMKDTYTCLKIMIENSDNIIMMGDFNCKEVCWEEWYTGGGEESWDDLLLDLVMNNIMTQWMKEKTRFRDNEEPSRLDLLLTKELEVIRKANYQCLLGKSEQVLIEFEVNYSIKEGRREEHKNGKYNDGKADFVGLRTFFTETDWSSFHATRSTQKKWDEFIRIYTEGIDRCVPRMVIREKKKNEWFTRRCELARLKREKHGKSGGKKEEETYGRNTKQLEINM